VLIVDFASLVFQTFTENEYNTETKKNRDTKYRYSRYYRYRRYCTLKIPISYRLKTDIDPSDHVERQDCNNVFQSKHRVLGNANTK